MAERNYSKREIDAKLDAIQLGNATFQTDVRGSLARIELKQDHTNGSVADAHKEIGQLNLKTAVMKARVQTAIIIMGFIVASILIPIVSAYISDGRI